MNKQLFSKRVKLALSILMVCVSLVSFVASPFLVQAGGGGGTHFGGTSVTKKFSNTEYAQLSYVYGDSGYAYRDFCSGTVSLDPSYKIFRVWVRLSDIVPKGASVNMNFNFSYATGSISSISMWFGEQNGQSASTLVDKSAEYSSTYSNSNVYFVDEPIVVLDDASMICFQIVFSTRSSSDMYLNFNGINYSYDVINSSDTIIDNQQEQIGQSKNIFDKIGDVLDGLGDLPTKIGSALSGFFGSLKISVDGVASKLWNYLSGPLSNILASISDNPEAVYNLFSGSLSDFLSKQDGILGGIGELPSKIGSALSGFFGSLETSVDGIGNDLWNYLAGPLSNILASISDNPEAIHNLFSGTLSEFMTKLDTEPDRIYSLFSGSLINMEDLMEKLLNPDSGIDHDFDQESSEAGEKLEQLAGDISVSKPDISDVETKVLAYTAASGIGQVAALFSIVTLNENVTAMLLAALSFGLMGLVFFGSKR